MRFSRLQLDDNAKFGVFSEHWSILNDLPQHACLGNADMLPEWISRGTDQKNEGRANLRFTIGVAIALALPVLISMSAYIATTAILKVN